MYRFFQRPYPSANTVLLEGEVLIDPGAGPDAPALLDWLGDDWPRVVVNTHWHSDHAGANHVLQSRGVPVWASAAEAVLINAREPDACRAWWLQQAVEAYHVDRALRPGDVAGDGWQVLALPGHSAAQIGLWSVECSVLICADALAEADVGWLDLDADPAALEQAEATIEAIAGLNARLALPGHGPAITDVPAAIGRARRRIASWRAEPERIGWHACKRILTHGLMLEGGLAREALPAFLLRAPWFRGHARRAFGMAPEAFVPMLIEEMVRSGAATWTNDSLVPAGPFTRPKQGQRHPGFGAQQPRLY